MSEVLQQVSSQLRLSLGNIYSALTRLAPPDARDGSEKIDRDAAVLCQSYYRILRLANNLSDASEPERPADGDLVNDDIVAFCQVVVDRAQGPAELLGIRLDFRCAMSGHIIAMDRKRLERLLLNLLSNAFKFIGDGEKWVTLEVRVETNYVFLTLSDTGLGIPAQRLDTVFDRCRETRRQDPPPHGLGLGLPICQRIAREHGGSLGLKSQEGQGTAVTVSLPNRRRTDQRVKISAPMMERYGGFNATLVELSDALPRQAFAQKYLN